MESSGPITITNGRPPPPSRGDIDIALDDAVSSYRLCLDATSPTHKTAVVSPPYDAAAGAGAGLQKDKNCKRLRSEEGERQRSMTGVTNMSSTLISKTVTPFLKEHIPSLYAPIGKPNNEETAKAKDPNTRYCYRHRPDSKCRRAADEAKMVMIQRELDKLTPAVGPILLSARVRNHAVIVGC